MGQESRRGFAGSSAQGLSGCHQEGGNMEVTLEFYLLKQTVLYFI